MSAAEIIEQIKQLPPEEKQAVREFIAAEQPHGSSITEAEFQAAADEVFSKYDGLLKKLAQ